MCFPGRCIGKQRLCRREHLLLTKKVVKTSQGLYLSYTNFRQEKQQKGCRINIGLSIKYKLYINMPETYSIMIFFFVPITEKTFSYEKILFFCWFLNNQSIKESFLSIPTLCFIVISFDILSKKKYIKPIFLNLSYLMGIGSCFPKVNWS